MASASPRDHRSIPVFLIFGSEHSLNLFDGEHGGEPRIGDTAAVVSAAPLSGEGAQALVLESVSETGETQWLSEASSNDVVVIWRAPNAT
jgi:hypothetical protein